MTLIIARSDGTPTYNFCVVVDDMDMGVTQCHTRDDHLNNTPRQMNMLEALGASVPQYAARAHDPGTGRRQALQASPGGKRVAVPGDGFSAGRTPQLSGAPWAGRTATRRCLHAPR